MPNQNATPKSLLKQFKSLAHGLANKPPAGQGSLVVGGASATVDELVAEYQGYADMYQAVVDAYNAYQRALAARAAGEPHAKKRRDALRAAIKGTLGRTNPELTAYGITPDKEPRPLTVEESALRVERAKATRAARHTMGKRQRLAIKGEVPPKT